MLSNKHRGTKDGDFYGLISEYVLALLIPCHFKEMPIKSEISNKTPVQVKMSIKGHFKMLLYKIRKKGIFIALFSTREMKRVETKTATIYPLSPNMTYTQFT